MRCLRLAALTGALLVPAYATPVAFSATGTFENGASLSGTVTIDTATGKVVSGDLAVSGVPTHFTTLIGQFSAGTPPPFVTDVGFNNGQAANNTLALLFEPVSLVGYGGGPLCGLSSANCLDPGKFLWVTQYFTLNVGSSTVNLQAGALAPAVPEPASVMLVATALLALGCRRRRRD